MNDRASSLPPPPRMTALPARGSTPAGGGRPVVEVLEVTKSFGDVVAVSGVSFTVQAGITALLGPNGAGKSTMFRLLCGLAKPTRGKVLTFGQNARSNTAVRGKIGLVPQQDALFERLTALEFVALAGKTHGLADADTRARQCLGLVDLPADEPKKIGSYSKGMKQRVKLAAALVNDPPLLICDEPLSGLDPVQRSRMIEIFHELGASGKCILVSSHVLEEVARIGSQVLVIAQGRLVASGDYRRLRDLMNDRPLRIKVVASEPRRLASELVRRSLVDGVSVSGQTVYCDLSDAVAFGCNIAVLCAELDVRLNEVVPTDDDLESVFRYLVERR